jgi:hypothetical protein
MDTNPVNKENVNKQGSGDDVVIKTESNKEEANAVGVHKRTKSWWKRNFGHKIKNKPCYSMEEYMENRVQYKIKIYDKKAGWNKRWYYCIAVITSISAAIVPVLVNWDTELIISRNKNLIITILSLLVTIGVALQEIYRFREHWRNFDLIYANLRREQLLYSRKAGPYAKKEDGEKENENNDKNKEHMQDWRDQLFVKNIEDLIKDERWDTINLQTTSNRTSDNK